MTTTIYLIRHGESEANRRNTFLGHYDLGLTDTGREQAEITANFLSAHVTPDVIYSSDLSRAYQTATPTAHRFGLSIQKDAALREIMAGAWENVPFDMISEQYRESYDIWKTDIGNAHPDGGESVLDLQRRIVTAVTRIAKENEGRVILLFTHATPIRVLAAHCKHLSADEIKTIPWVTNASVTKVCFDGTELTLEEYGRDDFMGDRTTRLSANV
ncbi:MAG: histidine phosphatase family protein [Clostridia bacterium]|nr:histidine phosphatase family protein [Clostridia bacterium]